MPDLNMDAASGFPEKPDLERFTKAWSDHSIRLILTPSQTAKSSFLYVQEAGYFETTPGYFTERKNLCSFLMIYTLKGQGTLSYLGRSFALPPHSLLLLDCREHHRYSCPEGGWNFLWIHFYGVTAPGLYKALMQEDFFTFLLSRPEEQFLAESRLRRILSLNQRKDRYTEVFTSCLITELVTSLFPCAHPESDGNFRLPEYLKKIRSEMEQNFNTRLTLDDFCKKYGVSRSHLSREFKKYTGSSFQEYLILLRLSYAKELLKYSEMSVGEIASACGISHTSHFIRLFEAREGTTPLKYRKEWH